MSRSKKMMMMIEFTAQSHTSGWNQYLLQQSLVCLQQSLVSRDRNWENIFKEQSEKKTPKLLLNRVQQKKIAIKRKCYLNIFPCSLHTLACSRILLIHSFCCFILILSYLDRRLAAVALLELAS